MSREHDRRVQLWNYGNMASKNLPRATRKRAKYRRLKEGGSAGQQMNLKLFQKTPQIIVLYTVMLVLFPSPLQTLNLI